MHRRSTLVFISIMAVVLAAVLADVLKSAGVFDGEPKLEIFPQNKSEEKLLLLADEDYWPYSYIDSDGQLTGHDIELANALANKLGVSLDIVPMVWEDALQTAGRHEADGVLACEYGDGESTDYGLIMTTPYESGEFVFFGKEHVDKLHQLAGTRIGMLHNGNVSSMISALGLDPWCVEYESNRAAFDALAAGECDYVPVRYVIGIGILRDLGERGRDIKPIVPLTRSNFYIGVDGNKPELAERISQAMFELKVDGTVEKLSDKWLTTYVEPLTISDTLRNYPWIMALVMAFVFITMIFVMLQIYSSQLKEKRHRAQLEEALESASRANASKTKFLFSMSHDIRTPMNAIIGYTTMAQDKLTDPEMARGYMEKIKYAGGQLLSLINQVLELSRIESGRVELESVSMNVTETARRVASTCGVDTNAKDIILNVDISAMEHPRVKGDASRISQILINILGNAIKYTPAGGSINYNARELPCEKTGFGLYEFVVSDTGVGMSHEFQKHIFEEFSRENSSTISGIQGTGLGLSIVKKLVDMMDGTVDISSEKGLGTTVTVRLPLPFDNSKSDEKSDANIDIARLDGLKVLLVEDNEMNLEIARYILEDMGASVFEERDGELAVQRVQNSSPGDIDVVLMDIQMPNMNGYEATRIIRSLPDPALAGIPIVAMTANAFKEDRDEAMKAGMNGHVAKPIDVNILRETLLSLT